MFHIVLRMRNKMFLLFERFFRRVKGPRGAAALFIIRYEGHVDLVTAHKPHFEIVETRDDEDNEDTEDDDEVDKVEKKEQAKKDFSKSTMYLAHGPLFTLCLLFVYSILDDKDVTIVRSRPCLRLLLLLEFKVLYK